MGAGRRAEGERTLILIFSSLSIAGGRVHIAKTDEKVDSEF